MILSTYNLSTRTLYHTIFGSFSMIIAEIPQSSLGRMTLAMPLYGWSGKKKRRVNLREGYVDDSIFAAKGAIWCGTIQYQIHFNHKKSKSLLFLIDVRLSSRCCSPHQATIRCSKIDHDTYDTRFPLLVGGLEHFIFFHILGLILPID